MLKEGYRYVVDADIEKYFDTINHKQLMVEVTKEITDGRVLELIGNYLQQGILEVDKEWRAETGTPQGAVISPLLANIYLHPVDEAMQQAGYQMIRYADDVVILCRRREEAEAALEMLSKQLTELQLKLHPVEDKDCRCHRARRIRFSRIPLRAWLSVAKQEKYGKAQRCD